ncbi:hypothetical protein LHU53_19255 [Rhodoferax sp. U2-2l]|uniref:hypothetical protein n=1 Tax=Rhodoferax sp. U2-2l TaxID=2884000 RepID=UPI001D0B8C2F|nr:hypothetical protein [Rhodoferax sp. U2-2l]MCB8749031.1 hypothetical protein [Rhodoferax sp. U2-2l]
MTDGFVSYLTARLWYAKSLRSVAAEVGAQPKTLADALRFIARNSRAAIQTPRLLGIHKLSIGRGTGLLLTNIEMGSTVDFCSVKSKNMRLLYERISEYQSREPLKLVAIPMDGEIACLVRSCAPECELVFSIHALGEALAQEIAKYASANSKRGVSNCVGSANALHLARRRMSEIPPDEMSSYSRELFTENNFWYLLEEKESILRSLESDNPMPWYDMIKEWRNQLRIDLRYAFHSLFIMLQKLFDTSARIYLDPDLLEIEQLTLSLQRILLKPGRSFSVEMVEVLTTAAQFCGIPWKKRIGSKGKGNLWVEEDQSCFNPIVVNSLGNSLRILAELLAEIDKCCQKDWGGVPIAVEG